MAFQEAQISPKHNKRRQSLQALAELQLPTRTGIVTLGEVYPHVAATENPDGAQLLTLSQHPIIHERRFLPKKTSRGLLTTMIQLPMLGSTILANMHLAALTNQKHTAESEISALRKLFQRFLPFIEGQKMPLILAGDTNLCPKIKDRDFGLLQQLQGSEGTADAPELSGLTQMNPILGSQDTWRLSPDLPYKPEFSPVTSASNDKIGYLGPGRISAKVIGKYPEKLPSKDDPRLVVPADHKFVLSRITP